MIEYVLHSRLVFKNEIRPAFFDARIYEKARKYPIMVRKGDEIYAIYCAGSCAGSKADGLTDLLEKLRAIRACPFFREHLHHENP